MPIYLCRWPGGDCSVVQAENEREAIIKLDEVDNAEGCPLVELDEFQVHFHLTDDGQLVLAAVGEETETALWDIAYPVLDDMHLQVAEEQADTGTSEFTPEQQERIRSAVQAERDRVTRKPVEEPETELGRDLKKHTGAATAVVNEVVRRGGQEALKKLKTPRKPH